MATWYTVDTDTEQTRLIAAWEDAPIENLETCAFILGTARDQVVAYGPTLPDGEPAPDRWVYAQLQQAKNLWNAGRVSSSGEVGVETYSFTPRPLDKTVKQIIRPMDGKPHVL